MLNLLTTQRSKAQATQKPSFTLTSLIFGRHTKPVLFWALGLTAMLSLYFKCTTMSIFPINHVQVVDSTQYLSKTVLKNIVTPEIQAGFFGVNVKSIKYQLEQLPWISHAVVTRHWPDGLIIQLHEQDAVARWNQIGIITAKGKLFFPGKNNLPVSLPLLEGPSGEEYQVLRAYQMMQAVLTPVGLQAKKVTETNRHSWYLYLDNGIKLALGQENMEARLSRFVKAYQQVFTHKPTHLVYVDLRYANGMAVRW